MDIYELKNELGHSGFGYCRVVDVNAYNAGEGQPDALFEGEIDDAPDNLDDLKITSIDLWYNEDARRIEVTIDVDGSPSAEDEGDDFDGEPIDNDAMDGQWYY